MERSQELVRPIAERLFEIGLDVRTVYKVLQGYAGYNTVARWRKEWGEAQEAQRDNFQAA